MKFLETKNEGLKRAYELSIMAGEVDEKVNEKLESVRADFPAKGFRKGKVPLSLIKQMHGKAATQEVIQELIDNSIKEHFEKSGDKPAVQPSIKMSNEDWKDGDDVLVNFEYETLPDIPKTDFSKLTVRKLVTTINKIDIDDALKNLAETTENFVSKRKTSKAANGDQLIFDFEGRIDDKIFDGGSAKDYPLVLGSNSFIPGFEEQLIGVKIKDTKEVKVTFPKDYGSEKLSGKDAIFLCKITDLKEKKPSKIDDELAKKYGSTDLKDLKSKLKDRLGEEYLGISRSIMKRELMDELDALVNFELPESLVRSESEQIALQLWREENPDVQENSKESIEPSEGDTSLAKRRVKLGLLLSDVGTNNEIKVDDNEIQKEIMSKARQYPGREKEFFDFIQKNSEAKQQLSAPVFEDKVIDFIVEFADVSEVKVSKEEIKKEVEKLESK